MASVVQVFTAYCAKKGLQEKECRFMYEGQRLQGDKTPEYVCHQLAPWS